MESGEWIGRGAIDDGLGKARPNNNKTPENSQLECRTKVEWVSE